MRTALSVLLLLAVAAAVQAGAVGNGNGLLPCSSFDANFGDRCRACGRDYTCQFCVQAVYQSGAVNPLNAADRCKPNDKLGRKCVWKVAQAAGWMSPPVDPTNYVDRCRQVQCEAHIDCLKSNVGGDAGVADACVRDSCGLPDYVCHHNPHVCWHCDDYSKSAHACKKCLQYYYKRGYTSNSALHRVYHHVCKWRRGGKKGL